MVGLRDRGVGEGVIVSDAALGHLDNVRSRGTAGEKVFEVVVGVVLGEDSHEIRLLGGLGAGAEGDGEEGY